MTDVNPFAAASQELRDPVADQAAIAWRTFTAGERSMVRAGIFPAEKMEAAERVLEAAGVPRADLVRRLAVALMDLARERRGGAGVQPALDL